jgi:hypothetical protein
MKYTLDQVVYICLLAPSKVQQNEWTLDSGVKAGRRKMHAKADALKILKSSLPTDSLNPKPRQKEKQGAKSV